MTSTLLALVLAACGTPEPTATAPEAAASAPAVEAEAPVAGHEGHDEAFAEISFEELDAVVKSQGAVLLDANGTDSFREGHIPGALDFEAVAEGLQTRLPDDKAALVVAYCGGPSCGAWKKAAEAVAALGYENVRHFKGGMSGWKEAEGAVEM